MPSRRDLLKGLLGMVASFPLSFPRHADGVSEVIHADDVNELQIALESVGLLEDERDITILGPGGVVEKTRLPWLHVRQLGAVCDGITNDYDALMSAFGRMTALGGGLVIFDGDMALGAEGDVVVPYQCGLLGMGGGWVAPASKITMLDADTRIYYEDGTGPPTGYYTIDGDDVAPNCLEFQATIRDVLPIDVINAAAGGIAISINRTQNSKFLMLNTLNCKGDHVIFDGGASSNKVEKIETGVVWNGQVGIGFRATYTVAEGAILWYPLDNTIERALVEYSPPTGTDPGEEPNHGGTAVYFGSGVNNIIRDCNLNRNLATVVGTPVVEWHLDDDIAENVNQNNRIEGGQIVGVVGVTTAIKIGAGCGAWFGRGVQIGGHGTAFDVDAGVTYVRTDGDFVIAFCDTRWSSPNGALENIFLHELTLAQRRMVLPDVNDLAAAYQVEGEAFPRRRDYVSGAIEFGPGSTAPDVTIFRPSAGFMRTNAAWWHQRGAVADPAIYANVTGDAGARASMDHGGNWSLGDGTNPPDVVLGRWAALLWGTFFNANLVAGHFGTGAWDAGHLLIGNHHFWVDSTGDLRTKSSAPTSDTDGVTVGSQT